MASHWLYVERIVPQQGQWIHHIPIFLLLLFLHHPRCTCKQQRHIKIVFLLSILKKNTSPIVHASRKCGRSLRKDPTKLLSKNNVQSSSNSSGHYAKPTTSLYLPPLSTSPGLPRLTNFLAIDQNGDQKYLHNINPILKILATKNDVTILCHTKYWEQIEKLHQFYFKQGAQSFSEMRWKLNDKLVGHTTWCKNPLIQCDVKAIS